MIKSISLLAVVLGVAVALIHDQPNKSAALDHSRGCKLGEKRRIGTGSYYEQCLPRFETSGCFASWITKKANVSPFVPSGETIERTYTDKKIGFLYRCEKTAEYIYFAPVSCYILRTDGKKETIPLNGKAKGNNGEDVYCKKNSDGEFSFEYGDAHN